MKRTLSAGVAAVLALCLVSCTNEVAGLPDGSGAPASSPGMSPSVDPSVEAASSPFAGDLAPLEDISVPEWQPETRSEELAMDIAGTVEDSGEPTLQQVIDAFDLTYLDMPGATPYTLPAGDGFGASYVRGLIEAHREDLSAEQTAVLDSLNSEEGPVATFGGGRSVVLNLAPGADVVKRYVALATQTWTDWHAYQPDFPNFTIQLELPTKQIKTKKGKTVGMDAILDKEGGSLCKIRVFPTLWAGTQTDQSAKIFFAHEIFHCRQQFWSYSHAGVPDWVIEGSADFAAFDLYRSKFSPPANTVDSQWFEQPARALASRDYDAWPLYETFAQSGGDAYGAIRQQITSGGSDVAALLASGGMTSTAFSMRWPTLTSRPSIVNDEAWQLKWPSPNATDGRKDNLLQTAQRGIGTFWVKGSDQYSHQSYVGIWTSDVGLTSVVPQGGPMQTHAESGNVTAPEGRLTRFCFDRGMCKCPDGETSDAIPMNSDMLFAFPTGAQAVRVAVGNEKWDADKHCRKPKRKKGSANGDPHLQTYDGLAFDIMSLAEFVTTRDPAGDFEVQSRHQPFAGTAAGTTAVAVKTDSGRITFTAKGLQSTEPIVVRVDGRETAAPLQLGDVAVTQSHADRWLITWPDGSTVEMDWHVGFFVKLELAPDRAARMEGMLGKSDDDLTNDLLLPDGSIVKPEADLEAEYAMAWRVDGATTLFDYEPGETFETFRLPLPQLSTALADEELTERLRADCIAELGQLATSAEISSCVFDVAATGDSSFTTAYVDVVDDRLADEGYSSLPGVDTSGPVAPPTSLEPTGEIVQPQQGVAALTLSGTISRDGSEPTPGGILQGAVHITAGSIVLMRTANCPPDITMWVYFTRLSDQERLTSPVACDGLDIGAYNADDDDETIIGEAYVVILQDGDYQIDVDTDADDPWFASMEVFVDPTPTIVDPEQLGTEGFSGTLSGVGDTVVLRALGGESGANWATTGLTEGCYIEGYGSTDIGDSMGWDLGRVCKHTDTLGMSPFDQVVLLVVFNRLAEDVPITVLPK